MQLEDIVSPTYSVSSQLLKLNSSSMQVSTPGEPPLGPLISFEQFTQPMQLPSKINKKKLTIEIDQEFEFENESNTQKQPEIIQPIPERVSLNKRQFQSNHECSKVQEEVDLIKQMQQMRLLLRRKDQQILGLRERNQDLSLLLGQLEQERETDRFYDQKLREKENKYVELQKIHQKVVIMNKGLQKELRENDKKIMELEKQLQKNVCSSHYEHLAKIKEGNIKVKDPLKVSASLSNKENTMGNTRTQDKKKTVTSQAKKTGRASSSSNISRKPCLGRNTLF